MSRDKMVRKRPLSKFQIMLNSMNQNCCQSSASVAQNRFCNDCGDPLFRCPAFECCGGLLDHDGKCSVCFSPKLELHGGHSNRATVGDTFTLPLKLSNQCQVNRELYVKGVWYRKGNDEWQPCYLPWDRLPPRVDQPINLIFDRLQFAGSHRVEIVIGLASRWQWQEEVFAFSAGLEVRVAGDKELVVQQNINYSAGAPQTGATIYAPIRISSDSDDTLPPRHQTSQELPLVRASVYERSFGWRGTSLNGMPNVEQNRIVNVKRSAKFQFKGFFERDIPLESPILSPNGMLSFGRSRTRKQGGTSDVRMLVFRNDNRIDEQVSIGISRDHFVLWLERGRLMLRVNSEAGLLVNSSRQKKGDIVEVKHGDVISPLVSHPRKLELKVEFEVEHDEVTGIQIRRRSQP